MSQEIRPIIATGSATNANTTCVLTDGSASCDFSADVVTANMLTNGDVLEVRDSAGRVIYGFIKAETGTVIDITNTPLGSTYNWGLKDASFDNDDDSGYTYRIISRHQYGALIAAHTVTAGQTHLATVAAGAMFFHDSIDFSAYAGNDTDSTLYQFVFEDSAGKVAQAYAGAVGSGEALGSELLSNGGFSGSWTGEIPDGWVMVGTADANNYIVKDDVNDTVQIVNKSGYIGIRQDGILNPIGLLYKRVADVFVTSGSLQIELGGALIPFVATSGLSTAYMTGAISISFYVQRAVNNSNAVVSSVSLKQVTEVPATGLHLLSAKNGSTRNMFRTESGFNPNLITKIRIYRAL